jgi:FtsP/CotA-like multicopper oxidase with cupredoxin domain
MVGGTAMIGSGILRPLSAFACSPEQGLVAEPFPTSPLILNPFKDPLPIPPVYQPSDPTTWVNPRTGVKAPPGPGIGQQDSDGGTHQVWHTTLNLPTPIFYKIDLRVTEHAFTTSLVQPINSLGQGVTPPDGIAGPRSLPGSTIWGFNGTFPGPRINAEYGRPCLVRFENHLDENPFNLDSNDFGSPDRSFLTHLHNAHTAPESDGNPHHKPFGYQPKQYCDNLYLNFPAGGDAREMQSYFWFHDHRMDHTGADVYKGMVGIYPIYDPAQDSGDEATGFRLPGVRTNLVTKKGTSAGFSVKYDIPLVFYDCQLDDGVTPHQDFHIATPQCGLTHPEYWGKTFFRHYPNHGFVGDIFTVNGTAYPVLNVDRRRYRFRFLDASISRIYEFKLMRSLAGPKPSKDTTLADGTPRTGVLMQGQYQLPDGQQCMRFVQVASEGGLLPRTVARDSFQIWPAKRREVVVDFSKYMDGSPTRKGDVVYLVDTLQMTTGRKPDAGGEAEVGGAPLDSDYKVPVLRFVLGGTATDRSDDLLGQAALTGSTASKRLRDLPPVPSQTILDSLPHRTFELQRSGGGGGGGGGSSEAEWLINGLPFDPTVSMADVKQSDNSVATGEVWTIANGGGGWVHPLHIHMEEHHVLDRNGVPIAPNDPENDCKEDVVALAPSESVTFYRKFRTFIGPYVCHCHNLAHEDHAMMFGWSIVP